MLKKPKTRHGNARRGGKNREATFRILMTRLRARTSLNAEEIQKLADFLSKLWRKREMLFNNRISRARKMLDSMLADEVISAGDITTAANAQLISTGDITTPENSEVISTGDITTSENEATEKREKEMSPLIPPKGKDQKRNTKNARTRKPVEKHDDEEFDPLFNEFWANYPKDCPRKIRRKTCREKYGKLMRKAKDPAALHAAILAGLERWRKSHDWNDNNGEYIKAPLAWLNQENWNDSPSPYSPRSAATSTTALRQDGYRPAIEIG